MSNRGGPCCAAAAGLGTAGLRRFASAALLLDDVPVAPDGGVDEHCDAHHVPLAVVGESVHNTLRPLRTRRVAAAPRGLNVHGRGVQVRLRHKLSAAVHQAAQEAAAVPVALVRVGAAEDEEERHRHQHDLVPGHGVRERHDVRVEQGHAARAEEDKEDLREDGGPHGACQGDEEPQRPTQPLSPHPVLLHGPPVAVSGGLLPCDKRRGVKSGGTERRRAVHVHQRNADVQAACSGVRLRAGQIVEHPENQGTDKRDKGVKAPPPSQPSCCYPLAFKRQEQQSKTRPTLPKCKRMLFFFFAGWGWAWDSERREGQR
eukprot:Rhum_TRINITY_DN14317_c4_g2::Rhum_TRINITY_DN14317_c4_g2_i1::g.80324::m.80324